jgi:hypothetical protein
MNLLFLYDLVGILVGAGGIMTAFKRHGEKRVRNAIALERNTEATERLSESVEKIVDKLGEHDKRLDKVEYKLWGV